MLKLVMGENEQTRMACIVKRLSSRLGIPCTIHVCLSEEELYTYIMENKKEFDTLLIDFFNSVDVARKSEGPETLSIKFKNTLSNIRIDDIRYVESNKRRVFIYTESGMKYCYERLDNLEKRLPDYFLRCHKSFLVNMKKIECMKGNEIKLYTGEVIRISRNKKNEAKDKYKFFLQKNLHNVYDFG